MGKPERVKPRIILHGGAGNITRENLPLEAYDAYRKALLGVLQSTNDLLMQPNAAALDVAAYAVSLLENNPLFNAGHGAVFTQAETHELEASVMVSKGYRKRGVGVMNVTRAKNPVLLAREMLVRGEASDGGGAGPHCQLQGTICDQLTQQWGLQTVPRSYYWTKRRWQEHRRGLGLDYSDETYERHRLNAHLSPSSTVLEQTADTNHCHAPQDPGWDGKQYLPQGTVGAVILDSSGTICVATSTGGLTNKLPGRIGDTPTLGAGFWAEEWEASRLHAAGSERQRDWTTMLSAFIGDCLPQVSGYLPIGPSQTNSNTQPKLVRYQRAVAMSGTGNGDSFLKLAAARTAAAMARFSRLSPLSIGILALQHTVTAIAGPNGALQQSAEDRWMKTGEGEGGIIGIDFNEGKGEVVADFNCGGMFRAWVDDDGVMRMAVFRQEG
ncbi:hypothetical protein BAUCODRAFT_63105 [Baudoinia panamericana UAMH 10762]|uniref:N-terminal nucleophile aminohydrolase n=1 Tax=Baudoinia panamericana (strain UAMH 10762) TaxID=717646 RepID=M2NL95_BAUPA|nr:uncharacterized protein BAUCODRAFT_63105 [Baudoinia panamericana UAMH 10762]EMC99930.1 hypothetical protein BAUCODRAFT_63105 [Baudoinia panamericana UAMH 10762]